MSVFGIRGVPDAAALADIGPGCGLVSIHCYSFDELSAILAKLPPEIETHIQLNSEWQEVAPGFTNWPSGCRRLAKLPRKPTWVSCGGELDIWHLQPPIGQPDPTLTPAFAANLVNVASPILRAAGIKVSTTSIASGEWQQYLQEMIALCWSAADAVDLHLYVKKLSGFPNNDGWQEAAEALDAAQRISGLPVICSEAGIKVDDAGGEASQAIWGGRLFDLTQQLDPALYPFVTLFAYSDGAGSSAEQGGQAFGMVSPTGRRKPLYRVIQNACGGMIGPTPIPAPPVTPPAPPQPIPEVPPVPDPNDAPQIETGITLPDGSWIGPGVAMYIRAHGLHPIDGEGYFNDRASLTPCEEGQLFYFKADGSVRFVAWSEAA